MASHCRDVMSRDLCAAYNSARDRATPAQLARPWVLGFGLGAVTVADVWSFRANPAMCEQLVVDCTADWNGAACRVARSHFRQTP